MRGALVHGVVSLEFSSLVALTASAIADMADELLSSESNIPMPISSSASYVSTEGDDVCSYMGVLVADAVAVAVAAAPAALLLLVDRFLQVNRGEQTVGN